MISSIPLCETASALLGSISCLGNAQKRSKESKCEERKQEFDFIIVGTGPGGSVLANRLSQSGKHSVLVIEAGRDDARLPEKLPEPSTANVPQPGDFHWGSYVRGPGSFVPSLISRGFTDWYFWEKNRDTLQSRSISYPRFSGWGGCTSHNATQAIRNGPYNWDAWAALGLNEWSFQNIQQYYLLVENRSQKNAAGVLYYNPAIAEPTQGSFNSQYYGLNGYVPLFHQLVSGFEPIIDAAVTAALNTPSNSFGPGGFSYPLNVDLDYPPTAAAGGTSLSNITVTDQTGSIIPPNQSVYVPFAVYNQPLYGDNGWIIPPEFANLGVPIPVTPITLPGFPQISGLSGTQRVSAANTYLYPAQSRKNLHIWSEILVTKIITCGKGSKLKAVGVEYLEGWNIYQTGRNPNIERAGFGGTPGDAKANSILVQQKGFKRVYAKKEVILCAGCFNTPQILLLSGIGNKHSLRQLKIKTKKHLPGIGQNLVDNQELFLFWQIQNNRPGGAVALAAKSTPSQPVTNFDLAFNGAADTQMLETGDPFVQKSWAGLKNLGALDITFGRNNFNNVLNSGEYVSNPPTTYVPFYSNPTNRMGLTVELEENNRSRGFLKLVSNDPTVPPFIVANFLSDPAGQDLQDFVDVFMNNIFPMMLALAGPGFFQQLLYPSPADVLVNGVTALTNISQIDPTKLRNWINNNVGAHHAGGTCKMGLRSDPMAVVNQSGQVHGVRGLRVCDMSLVPISIRWPNINLYVIAEKIAHDVLAKYGA